MSAHTPGPWRLIPHEDRMNDRRVVGADDICPGVVYGDIRESNANARLIAAAPDLLAALQKLVEACEDSDDARYGTLSTSFVRDIARAAIAAAEGRS